MFPGCTTTCVASSDFDGGADIFWKPNGQFQMTATINPDFGQVESDDLVVNFGATETFISDKRPFFTENQGMFEYTTPSDFSQLLYTRRVGGPADDGNGSGDITAAVKLNGSLGADQVRCVRRRRGRVPSGRSFGALRLVRDFDKQNLGMMLTRVDRPYLDREATVLGVDHNWRPNQRWNVQTRVFGSQIEQSGEHHERPGRHALGRLRNGPRLAPAVDRHAFRQRPADQRCRLPVAQQHQLSALGGAQALRRPAGRIRAIRPRNGAGGSAATTTTMAKSSTTSSA